MTTTSTSASGAHRKLEVQAPDDADDTSLLWWVRTIGGWLLLLVLGFILLALVVVPRATGAHTYTVLTGSMEPAIAPGALVVVRSTPADQLSTGDVITFQPYSGNPAVVTHRIVGIFYDGAGTMQIQTQGDANNTADDWSLVPEQVRGKLWYSIPQLGRMNVLLTGETRAVAVSVVAGGLTIYAVWMFGSGLRDRARQKKADLGEKEPNADALELQEGVEDVHS